MHIQSLTCSFIVIISRHGDEVRQLLNFLILTHLFHSEKQDKYINMRVTLATQRKYGIDLKQSLPQEWDMNSSTAKFFNLELAVSQFFPPLYSANSDKCSNPCILSLAICQMWGHQLLISTLSSAHKSSSQSKGKVAWPFRRLGHRKKSSLDFYELELKAKFV